MALLSTRSGDCNTLIKTNPTSVFPFLDSISVKFALTKKRESSFTANFGGSSFSSALSSLLPLPKAPGLCSRFESRSGEYITIFYPPRLRLIAPAARALATSYAIASVPPSDLPPAAIYSTGG